MSWREQNIFLYGVGVGVLVSGVLPWVLMWMMQESALTEHVRYLLTVLGVVPPAVGIMWVGCIWLATHPRTKQH